MVKILLATTSLVVAGSAVSAATITSFLQPVSYVSVRKCCPSRTEMLTGKVDWSRRDRKRCEPRRDGAGGGDIGGKASVTGGAGGFNEVLAGHFGNASIAPLLGSSLSGGGGSSGGVVPTTPYPPVVPVPGPAAGSGLVSLLLAGRLLLFWGRRRQNLNGTSERGQGIRDQCPAESC